MDQIPRLKVQINEMKKIVKIMSEAVKERYKIMKSQEKIISEKCNNTNEESDLLQIHAL